MYKIKDSVTTNTYMKPAPDTEHIKCTSDAGK
jgi:hypothetical protein